jgi:hypothetical protein
LQNASPGVVIGGMSAYQYLGNLVCSIDDVNGDGYGDTLILGGATSSMSGTLYLVFGSQYSVNINVNQMSANQGIKITGSYFNMTTMYHPNLACGPAGDVNGDGYNDFIIGAPLGGAASAGAAYLIYGKAAFAAINVNSLSTSGITISSATRSTKLGFAVAAAGDVNNDGYADVLITTYKSGYSYVYYGSSSPSSVSIIEGGSIPTQIAVIRGPWFLFGFAAAGVGDIDGDSYDDIMISCPQCHSLSGYTYVIWGKAITKGVLLNMLSASWDVPTLTSNANGFVLVGAGGAGSSIASSSGIAISSAGDFNGDGRPDILVGASDINEVTGAAYVIYGSAVMPARITLANLKVSTGFPIYGDSTGDHFGISLASAGDVNSDGYDDIVVGAPFSNQVGAAYVIFGAATHGAVTVGSMPYTVGFACYGPQSDSEAGFSVSGGFDVNQDGYDDVIVGSPYSDPITGTNAGSAYVVYGQASVSKDISLSALTTVNTLFATATSATSVNFVGNVSTSAKKYTNMIIGVPGEDNTKGVTYVLFGSSYAFRYLGNLSNFGTAVGITIRGASVGDNSGFSVGSAGDVDNDGWGDIIIGAPGTSAGAGTAYIIYGGNGLRSNIKLSSLTSSQGFLVAGAAAGHACGYSASKAGDVNGDGYDDVIVGCNGASSAYIIYGQPRASLTSISLVSGLASSRGFQIYGGSTFVGLGYSVGDAGDFNGDGYSDIVVGSTGEY